MGLIPLTLKDIAWPERRLVPVSSRLPAIIETIVRALGLVPEVVTVNARTLATNTMVRWAWSLRKGMILVMIGISTLALFASFAALAIVEVYSKRAALGCPYPVFVLTWYVGGLLPAVAHSTLSRLRESWAKRREEAKTTLEDPNSTSQANIGSSSAVSKDNATLRVKQNSEDTVAGEPKEDAQQKSAASAIQGAEEWWLVQLIWAIYYIAGTLIFTCIMAVTVIELFAWVFICFAVTGCSKLLALFLCLAFEDIPW